MAILGQDFYTAYNTVKDVAQSVAVGQEVDRKKNLVGSLNNLYQERPQATLEDIRAQYAIYGTPEDLMRLDEKIYGRDLQKAGTKFKFYQDQLNFAKESNDVPAQKAIVDKLNLDPDIGKFIGQVQLDPTGSYTFTAVNKMKFPNPANPNEMIDVLPGDIYQINQSNQLTKVNSQYRQASNLANQKAGLKAGGTGVGKIKFTDPYLLKLHDAIATQVQAGDPAGVAPLIASLKSDPAYQQVLARNPKEVAEFNKEIQSLGLNLTGVNVPLAYTGKGDLPKTGKTVVKTGKTKDGRTAVQYSDGTVEIQ